MIITEICNGLKPENEKEETGLKILCQIKNTMSDSDSALIFQEKRYIKNKLLLLL